MRYDPKDLLGKDRPCIGQAKDTKGDRSRRDNADPAGGTHDASSLNCAPLFAAGRLFPALRATVTIVAFSVHSHKLFHVQSDASSTDDILETLRKGFPGLSRQLQLGARFLVDHPTEVALTSMRELAKMAGVHPPTLVRLAQALGFTGWPELRLRFIERVRIDPQPYARRAKALTDRSDRDRLFLETLGALGSTIETSRARIDGAEAQAAARAIERAATVHVAGFRSSFAPAFSFAYAYRLFCRRPVMLIGETGGGFEGELRLLAEGDAVLLVGFAPYSRESGIVAEAARAAKTRLIVVTDSVVSPLARQADHVLLFSTDSLSFFPSVIAASAVLESLVALLVARGGSDAVAAVRSAEEQLHALGAYMPQEKAPRR
jgi:DNA-binding MurR/RpiR family transcriptional regulator